MKIEAACKVCGVTFQRFPSEARTTNLFCTKRCNAMFQANGRKIKTSEQFWNRVATGKPDECWAWQGYRTPLGYGQTAWNGRVVLAHRVAMSLYDGDWDSPLLVCHTCDNPPCCNPSHLWRGTHYQNQHDKIAKSRARSRPLVGSKSPRAKLTETDVMAIRSSVALGVHLAEKYAVSQNTISRIRRQLTWRHV